MKPQAAPDPVDDRAVWRALADPTRRALLDLLRAQPMTTGDLADRFAVTRFAVMKHLNLLVEAGLVMVRRRGRQRWNHLNPLPIQVIHERWIRPFEIEFAERLIRLKAVAEREREEIPMPQKPERSFHTIDVQHEIRINATPDRVWQALTADIAAWWPAKFYVGTSPVRFTLDPRVGGLVFEDWGDGEGALWATVTTVRRGEYLQWTGDLPAEYGGPGRTITSFTLKAEKKGTLLQFRDTMFGEFADPLAGQLQGGWKFLLTECFQPFVEHGTKPDRPASVVEWEDAT